MRKISSILATLHIQAHESAGQSGAPCARRYVAQVIAESAATGNGEARPFYSFLESCLRHKTEMVIFEAARAICAMRDVSTRELAPAVTVLQLFLSSSKPVLRFAAVRTLNKARGAAPGDVAHAAGGMCWAPGHPLAFLRSHI